MSKVGDTLYMAVFAVKGNMGTERSSEIVKELEQITEYVALPRGHKVNGGAYFVLESLVPFAVSIPHLIAYFETEDDLTMMDFDTVVVSLENGAKRIATGGG